MPIQQLEVQAGGLSWGCFELKLILKPCNGEIINFLSKVSDHFKADS